MQFGHWAVKTWDPCLYTIKGIPWGDKNGNLWTCLLRKSTVHNDVTPRIREADCLLGPAADWPFSHWLVATSFPLQEPAGLCIHGPCSATLQWCSFLSKNLVTTLPGNKNSISLLFHSLMSLGAQKRLNQFRSLAA